MSRSVLRSPSRNLLLGVLGFVVESGPGIVVIGREHMSRPDTAGEIVMPVEIPVASHLNEPGTAAGAAGHIAGDGDDRAARHLPASASPALAGLPCLAIKGARGWIAVGVVRLLDALIVGPAGSTNHVCQISLAVGRDDRHAKIMVQIIRPGI